MKIHLWIILLLSASPLTAEDIVFSRTKTQSGGKTWISEYTVSVEKAASFPHNPLTEGVLLSFEEGLTIAADAVAKKWKTNDIGLNTAHFSYSISKPKFHFWVYRFYHFSESEQRTLHLRVVVLPDGSIVEPNTTQQAEKN